MKQTKEWEPKIVQGLIVWMILSKYTSKFAGSKISNLPIDRIYPTYIYYGKLKITLTYPYTINYYLRIT